MKNAWAVWACLWAAFACKPGVGSRCEKGEARCIDEKRQLVCQADMFIESPCRGPGGCAQSEQGTSCDFSQNQPGDPCSTDDDGAALCAGPDRMIACRNGSYQIVPCRGQRGCVNEGGFALCDQSVAMLGDGCKDENKKACASDGKSVLVCQNGVMNALYACRGERGCSAAGGKLDCDMSVAREGDPCDKTMEGSISCSEDRSSTMICKGEKFALDAKCKPKTRCTVDGTKTECAAAN